MIQNASCGDDGLVGDVLFSDTVCTFLNRRLRRSSQTGLKGRAKICWKISWFLRRENVKVQLSFHYLAVVLFEQCNCWSADNCNSVLDWCSFVSFSNTMDLSILPRSIRISRSSFSSLGQAYRQNLNLETYGGRYSVRVGRVPLYRKSLLVVAQNRRMDDIASTVKALQSRKCFPKRWLGQHYMVNELVNAHVVEAAEIRSGDLVLEIGPGTGSLTKALVDAGAHVVAVEKDPDMAALVVERFQNSGQVQVVQVDFLKWPLTSEIKKLLKQREGVAFQQRPLAKVVSNLPFNITTNVLKRLLPMGDVFSRIVLLLQDEAALRLTNSAPTPHDYRPMTIVVNFFSVPEYKFKVSRNAFFPQPRVDGAVIAFQLKKESEYPLVGAPKIFFSMINSAFNGKRKMLRKSLQHMFTRFDIQTALLSGGLPETVRPEELNLEQFIAFYNSVNEISSASKKTGDESASL